MSTWFGLKVARADVWLGAWGRDPFLLTADLSYNGSLPFPDATGTFTPPSTFSDGWSEDKWIEILNGKSADGRTCVFASQFQTARPIDVDVSSGPVGSCTAVRVHCEDVVVLGWDESAPPSTYRFESIDTVELEVSNMVGVVAGPRRAPRMLLRRADGGTTMPIWFNHNFAYQDVWVGTHGGAVAFDWNVTWPFPDGTATKYDDSKAIDKRFVNPWGPQTWISELERLSAQGITCAFAAQWETLRVLEVDDYAGALGGCMGVRVLVENHVLLGWTRAAPRSSFRFIPLNTEILEVSTMVGVVTPPRGIPSILVRRPV